MLLFPFGKIKKEEQSCLCSTRSTPGWKLRLSSSFLLPRSLSFSLARVKQWIGSIDWMNCFRRKAISSNTAWARIAEYLPDLICRGTVITLISSCRAFYFVHWMRFFIVTRSIGSHFQCFFNCTFAVHISAILPFSVEMPRIY